MTTTVTSKGQVTIPKPVRDLLGIEPGMQVSFELGADGRVYLANASVAVPPPSRFAKLIGIAGPGMTTDEIMEMTRGTD
jgi:AbrB family looped-hinge helix DNA binding protein